MFTIDASVHINALNSREEYSEDSQSFLAHVHRGDFDIYSPTLLLVEVAASIARIFDSTSQGVAVMHAIKTLPGQNWIPLDDTITHIASELGAKFRLRGADAVYAAVTQKHNTTLVTLDKEQLARLSSDISTLNPKDALQNLKS